MRYFVSPVRVRLPGNRGSSDGQSTEKRHLLKVTLFNKLRCRKYALLRVAGSGPAPGKPG